eukprot:2897416-Prymnesium_polylepis.1
MPRLRAMRHAAPSRHAEPLARAFALNVADGPRSRATRPVRCSGAQPPYVYGFTRFRRGGTLSRRAYEHVSQSVPARPGSLPGPSAANSGRRFLAPGAMRHAPCAMRHAP